MSGLRDSRNRPAVFGSVALGVALFFGTWLLLGWQPLVAWVIGWSVPAFGAYAIDKAQAKRDGWRVPELVLHGLALVGGFPGAWAGRLAFHHKTQKPVFLVVLVVASVAWAVLIGWVLLGR